MSCYSIEFLLKSTRLTIGAFTAPTTIGELLSPPQAMLGTPVGEETGEFTNRTGDDPRLS